MSTVPNSPASLPTFPITSQNLTECHTSSSASTPDDASPTTVEVHRSTTPPDGPAGRRLSPRQLAAIPLVLQGRSDQRVAAAVGVARESVNRWRNHHPAFIAELNRQRRRRHADTLDRYDRLLNRSMQYIEQFQRRTHESWLDDQVKLATALLRSASRRTLAPNPDDVEAQLLADHLPISPDDSPADDAPPPPPTPTKRRRP